MPEWSQINSIEAHPTEKGGLYVAATSYKLDDFRPYLYKTTDYGKTWTKIVTGIPADHFTRVVRADPEAARACSTPAPSAACTSRSTTARTGSRSS